MLTDIKIAPSILSADLAQLGHDLDEISTADLVHVDVMDGHFVPNLSWGVPVLKAVKASTSLPADVHLMVSNPDETVGMYLDAGADIVTFHIEAATHAHRLVSLIHERGAKAGIALNPATPVCALDAIIEDVDMVLIMTVNPGFGGQRFIGSSVRKLRQLSELCHERGVSPLVEVDGGIDAQTARLVSAAGANVLVAGSAVYGKQDRAAAIEAIRLGAQQGLCERG